MSDDLVKRLRATTDGATVNPDGPEAAARIEELEAALKKIVRKTRHAHPMAYVSEYYRIAHDALEGGKKDE